MKEFVEGIAKALVDYPDDVDVTVVEGTHPGDLGKVTGQSRTAKAIRTLPGASGMKLHKRFTLEIVEEKPSGNGMR